MLCDDVLEQASRSPVKGLFLDAADYMNHILAQEIAPDVVKSLRYVFDSSVVYAIQEMTLSAPDTLLDIIDMMKLPHDPLWIEWSPVEAIRTVGEFGLAPLPVSGIKELPEKSGALYWRDDSLGEGGIRARMAFRFKGGAVATSPAIATISPMAPLTSYEEIKDVVLSLSQTPDFPGYMLRNSPDRLKKYTMLLSHQQTYSPPLTGYLPRLQNMGLGDPKFLAHLSQMFRASGAEMAGDIYFLLGAVLMLNTFNATRATTVDLQKLNKARERRAKSALLEHSVVSMRLSKPERQSNGETGSGNKKRGHICRGHFKKIPRPGGETRLVWWREHWRGGGPRGPSPLRKLKV